MTQAYEGIRILDFTQLMQGPSGTQVLADFGAEVIKVEKIDTGEIGRQHEPRLKGWSPHWGANNRNKQSLSIDLKSSEGKRIIFKLVENADIVASNFRPGVMERLGFGYADLKKINPRIICAYASGYGQTGPYKGKRGQDLSAQALGGLMALTGEQDGPPVPTGTFAVDYLASMQFAQGMMAALAAREKTGVGQTVDCSLLNAAVSMHIQEGTTYLNTGRQFPRPYKGVAHAHNTALYGRYRTKDNKHVVLIGEFYIKEPWKQVAKGLDLAKDIINDERFHTTEGLLNHISETYEIISEGFLKFDREDAISRLEEQDVLVAPVNDYNEVFLDPQIQHNEMVIEAKHEKIGNIKLVGIPVKLSGTPGRLNTLPPTVGEHNEKYLKELGYSENEIVMLQQKGVVGMENIKEEKIKKAFW